MPSYGAVYENYDKLQDAIAQLNSAGIHQDQIQVIRRGENPLSLFPDDYDPFGGYRFTGTHVGTMAAAGENLTGNSVTVDVRLDMLPDLLAETARQVDAPKQPKSSYLLVVEADHPDIEKILSETDGEIVNIDSFSPPNA